MLNRENKELVKTYKKILIGFFVITFLISSFFGALFGFMAGNLGQGKFSLDFLKKNQNQVGQKNSGSGELQCKTKTFDCFRCPRSGSTSNNTSTNSYSHCYTNISSNKYTNSNSNTYRSANSRAYKFCKLTLCI